ncbi:MAG TPA: acyltransferase family protein [Pseudorhodoplanes sp.]|nr:acyltransferase family protein [Pseudorhodoplanes sp.]
MQFRDDINGLRAVSVAAVVLYHFGVFPFSGGFVGVDVFFVISGYLMTAVILADQRGLLSFYAARAVRIVPALALLCVVILALGWFILSPAEYRATAAQAVASLGFFSNIANWWREGDYFAPTSLSNWFLHTWSLSVEWQFYMLYPLLLLGLRVARASCKAIRITITAIFLLSLAASVYASSNYASASFYLLPMRAWEMLLGALVYLNGDLKVSFTGRKIAAYAGLVTIVSSALLFTSEDTWPSYLALLPTGGAALVILSADKTNLINTAIFQWLGRASYSIYLWHWPVVVGTRFFEIESTAFVIVAGILISCVLGFASYFMIELPTARTLKETRSATGRAVSALSPIPIIGILAAAIIWKHGIPDRVPEAVNKVLQVEAEAARFTGACDNPQTGCTIGAGPLRAIMIGDSLSLNLAPAAQAAYGSEGGSILLFAYGGCPTVFGAQIPRFGHTHRCADFNATAWKTILTLPDVPVFIVNRTPVYIEGFNEMSGGPFAIFNGERYRSAGERKSAFLDHAVSTLCIMASLRRVVFVNSIPEIPFNVPRGLARRMMFDVNAPDVAISRSAHSVRTVTSDEIGKRTAEKCGVSVLDPLPYLCDAKRCFGSREQRPLYRDSNHLSHAGSAVLVPMFETFLEAGE